MLPGNLGNTCVCVYIYMSLLIIVCVLQGALFFDGLLQKLQTVYQFKLEDYMDGMAIRARPLRKTVQH